jgi:hypothetical protein
MRTVTKAVSVVAALILVFASVQLGHAAAVALQDDSLPAGTLDRYFFKCQGSTDISASVTTDIPSDEVSVVVLCTGGDPDSKGDVATDSGVGGAAASVGPKCEKADIDVKCITGICGPTGCGGYTITLDCVGKNIDKVEFTDDLPF